MAKWAYTYVGKTISIHAPRGGSDGKYTLSANVLSATDFNPRSPWGERRYVPQEILLRGNHFNPRSPWGERPIGDCAMQLDFCLFQSTLPVGGATLYSLIYHAD